VKTKSGRARSHLAAELPALRLSIDRLVHKPYPRQSP
jgi:hypothetical protein